MYIKSIYTRKYLYVPASLVSMVKVFVLFMKPFFRPLPLLTTLLASPTKRFVFTAPGFFSTVSTDNPDVSMISEGFPTPDKYSKYCYRKRSIICIKYSNLIPLGY